MNTIQNIIEFYMEALYVAFFESPIYFAIHCIVFAMIVAGQLSIRYIEKDEMAYL